MFSFGGVEGANGEYELAVDGLEGGADAGEEGLGGCEGGW